MTLPTSSSPTSAPRDADALERYLAATRATPLLGAAGERALSLRIHRAEGALRRALSRSEAAIDWLLDLGVRLAAGEVQPREALLLPPAEDGQERLARSRALALFEDLAAARWEARGGGLRARARLARAARRIRLNAAFLQDLGRAAAGTPGLAALEAGLAEARGALVQANLRFVVKLAFGVRRGAFPVEDLIQEGNLGLMRAVERFDAGRGLRFTTFAGWSVRDAMIQALDTQSRTVRQPSARSRAARALFRQERSLASTLGRAPEREELAEVMGWSYDETDGVLAGLPQSMALEGSPEDERPAPLDTLRADEPSPLEVCERKAMDRRLAEAVAGLPPRERHLLRLRYGLDGGEGCTLREAGQRLGISGARAQQIEAQAVGRLRASLEPAPLERTA